MEPQRPKPGHTLWESEAERLGRQIASIGEIDFKAAVNWDLNLSSAELAEANWLLAGGAISDGGMNRRLIGLSIGTKQQINDWGDRNWEQVLRALGQLEIGPLVLLGAAQDRARSQQLAHAWPGPSLNLCGQINPRISAAVLRRIAVFLCHDSGPMHLAAAVGTPCVAVFSRLNPPGRWFPFGTNHTVLYPSAKGRTIQSISPRQAVDAAVRSLERYDASAARESSGL